MKTYAGIEEKYAIYESSKVCLLPVPYDATSTWGKGADKGPEAFLTASENMEIYDLESDTEVYKKGVWMDSAPNCNVSPEELAKVIKQNAKLRFEDDKLFTMIGGEHSVSIGAIMAAKEKYPDVSVLQLDAHSDLRKEYLGSEYNHACALHWASKNTNLVQVGIRSMDVAERKYVNKDKVFYAEDIAQINDWQQSVIDKLGNDVYLTIDLDYFDPSILPSTGTPEPGGLGWYPTLDLLKKLAKQKNIIGFDIVELAPVEGFPASDFLAAKLYYKLLTYIFEK